MPWAAQRESHNFPHTSNVDGPPAKPGVYLRELPKQLKAWVAQELRQQATQYRGVHQHVTSALESISSKSGIVEVAQFIEENGQALVNSLKAKGIRRIGKTDDWKRGAFSIAIPFGKSKQLLRLSSSAEKRPKIHLPLMLKPIDHWDVNGIRVEVFPEISTENVTDAHVTALATLAPLFGCYFWDLRKANVGLFHGIPLILDPGAALPVSARDEALLSYPPEMSAIISKITDAPVGSMRFMYAARKHYSIGNLPGTLREDELQHWLETRRELDKVKFINSNMMDQFFGQLDMSWKPINTQGAPAHSFIHDVLIPLQMGTMPDEDTLKNYDKNFKPKGTSSSQEYSDSCLKHAQELLKDFRDRSSTFYHKTQKRLYRENGLKEDAIEGVIDDVFLNTLKKDSVVRNTVKTLGLDIPAMQALSRKAIVKVFTTSKTPSWRELIKVETEQLSSPTTRK